MNFYKHYLGDYARDTQGLSLIEHGAYRVLLDHCYATEKPLPADLREVYRVAGAMTTLERKAVGKVADAFFPVCEDGLRHNARCDDELADAQAYASAQAERAQMRWHRPGISRSDASHSHSQKPQPEKARSKAKAHAPKTPLPPDFGISRRVQTWADGKGYAALELHLEAFRSKALAKGYTYADWDEGFMGAIRDDWAGLRSGNGGARSHNPNRQESLEERNLRVAANWTPPEDA